MYFADVHMHALFGVDDGASDRDEMLAMIQAAYQDGVRLLCLTPHFHPGYYGDNIARSQSVFEGLQAHCQKAFPDLQLLLGNELHYSSDCTSWLHSGACRTVGGTQYVLVDFADHTPAATITTGLVRLLNAGYSPVLAHTERYRKLTMQHVREILRNGILLQMNAGSLFGQFGFAVRRRAKALLARHAVSFVGSDAHDMKRRPPGIGEAYRYIADKHGVEYADQICYNNAAELLFCSVSRED